MKAFGIGVLNSELNMRRRFAQRQGAQVMLGISMKFLYRLEVNAIIYGEQSIKMVKRSTSLCSPDEMSEQRNGSSGS